MFCSHLHLGFDIVILQHLENKSINRQNKNEGIYMVFIVIMNSLRPVIKTFRVYYLNVCYNRH